MPTIQQKASITTSSHYLPELKEVQIDCGPKRLKLIGNPAKIAAIFHAMQQADLSIEFTERDSENRHVGAVKLFRDESRDPSPIRAKNDVAVGPTTEAQQSQADAEDGPQPSPPFTGVPRSIKGLAKRRNLIGELLYQREVLDTLRAEITATRGRGDRFNMLPQWLAEAIRPDGWNPPSNDLCDRLRETLDKWAEEQLSLLALAIADCVSGAG